MGNNQASHTRRSAIIAMELFNMILKNAISPIASDPNRILRRNSDLSCCKIYKQAGEAMQEPIIMLDAKFEFDNEGSPPHLEQRLVSAQASAILETNILALPQIAKLCARWIMKNLREYVRVELICSFQRLKKERYWKTFFAGSEVVSNRTRTLLCFFVMHIFTDLAATCELNERCASHMKRWEQSFSFMDAFVCHALACSQYFRPVAKIIKWNVKESRQAIGRDHNWFAHHFPF